MLLKLFSATMVMLTGHLIYGLPMGGKARKPRESGSCLSSCPAGYYFSNCECRPCKSGFFTNEIQRETSCHRCFQSCKPENNMEVVKPCTTTSDVVCRCQEGYKCNSTDKYTSHCDRCDPVTTPRQSPTHTTIGITAATTLERADSTNNNLVWISFALFSAIIFIIILAVMLQVCRKKEEECFKKMVRQCSLGADVNSETMPPIQPEEQFHAQETLSHISTPTNHNTESFHQPVSSEQAVPPTGNLGPLHIYGPNTVFVSLLNQFGWDGGEKKAHELQQESLSNSNMSYPQSPPVHLSEEERSGEGVYIFPSQEQGKECHISKEEML